MEELTEHDIVALQEQLRVLENEISAQGNVIKELKAKNAERAVTLAAVATLNDLKTKKTFLSSKLFPPEVLDIDRQDLEDTAKRRSFFFPSFSIYGGFRGLFDLGPPGCAIKANLLNYWRQFFVLEENMLEIDTTCLTPDIVLKVSGHVEKFKDLMVKDVMTGTCHRADHLLEDHLEKLIEDNGVPDDKKNEYRIIKAQADNYSSGELHEVLQRLKIKAPLTGNDITEPFPFNLMFETKIGPTGDSFGFMRPETAQGIFCNFSRLLEYNGGKLPFAGATIGLAFRNEISPRNALLRVREFQLAEIEHFLFTDQKDHERFDSIKDYTLQLYSIGAQKTGTGRCIRKTCQQALDEGLITNQTHAYFMARTQQFLINCGIRKSGLRFRQHLENEKAHYAIDCWDAEILTSYGWVECVGIADRACYDLTKHSEFTKQRLGAFREFPDGARVVEIKKIVPNKGVIGKQFGKQAKSLFDHFDSLSESDISELEAKINQGVVEIVAGGHTFAVSKEHVKFTAEKQKKTGETIIPGVIEPSFGIGRIIYAILEHAFLKRPDDEKKKYFSFSPIIAPVKCSVLPLLSTEAFAPLVKRVRSTLAAANISHKVDDVGKSIGRRYARTDEIGIPFGITIDHQSLKDETVTLRDRDSTLQIRVSINELPSLLNELTAGRISWMEIRGQPEKYPHFDPVADDDE